MNDNVIKVILMWFMSSTMKKITGVMYKEHITPSLMNKDKNGLKLPFDLIVS